MIEITNYKFDFYYGKEAYTDTGTVLLSCLDFFNSIFTYPCKITNFHLFVNTTEPSPLSGRFYSNLSTAASYPPITLSSPYIISARR